ncbi:YrhB domain-containing protein [Actinoplanes sp. NPDC026623]|uniref:YrhB domain-containing protein n=1 Tax=Actinoplanes sp. NPDC026623 TaxID=3155610 RepID=UPI0033F7BDE1
MITRERAVELVEAQLAAERRELPAEYPEVAVSLVEENVVGWLVFWQSAEYLRTREFGKALFGQGPYLVDRHDGSIHHIPFLTFADEGWEELYLEQVKGVRPPDPLPSAVRDLVASGGGMAALRQLRRRAPQLTILEAKAYVDAVRNGDEPPEDLVERTRPRPREFAFAIETLTGPA